MESPCKLPRRVSLPKIHHCQDHLITTNTILMYIGKMQKQRGLEEQGVFQKKRSCMDQLFTVKMLTEKVIAKNKNNDHGM